MLTRKTIPPRGVLHVPKNEPLVGLERFEPSHALRPLIEHYWAVTWERQPKVLRETVPHPAVHLVFEPNASQVHGIHLKRFSRWIEGTGRVLGVKFRPSGFRAFTKSKSRDLTNKIFHPSNFFGPSVLELESKVVGLASAEGAFELIDVYLLGLKPILYPEIEIVNQIVEAIREDRMITRAEMVAERFQFGLRKLQRLFSDFVGVSPKWVIQRFRLIDAAERIRDSNSEFDYANFALQLGYSDQSHSFGISK